MTSRREKSILAGSIATIAIAFIAPNLLIYVIPRAIHAVYAALALAAIGGILIARYFWNRAQPAQWSSEGRCRSCGYDLYRLTAALCPECGRALTPAEQRYAASDRPVRAIADPVERRRVFAFVMGLIGVAGATFVPAPIVRMVPVTWHAPVWLAVALCFAGFLSAISIQFWPPPDGTGRSDSASDAAPM